VTRQPTTSLIRTAGIRIRHADMPKRPNRCTKPANTRDRTGEHARFNHGSLYMVVRQLATAGFVVDLETNRQGQCPERTVYALTNAGRQELGDWLRELVEVPQYEYPHFVAALSLIAALPPGELSSC
jgi:Transcriptional regulator PadR-like family